jgi:hypothetical protein
MTQYEKSILVMDHLQALGLNMLTVGRAVDNDHLEKSYQTIKENPDISKRDFLKIMKIKEIRSSRPDYDAIEKFMKSIENEDV